MELLSELVKEKKLGKGGQGDVYQAVNVQTGEVFALKEFSIPTALEAGEAFQEAALVMNLEHPNIIMNYGFSVFRKKGQGWVGYFLMEIAKDGSLREAWQKAREEKKELGDQWDEKAWQAKSLRWLSQIAEGLVYLHTNGVVHRDIKLENAMLSGDVVKLTDFGLSRFYQDTLSMVTAIGTESFMSPQQFRNEPYTNKVDVWQFGSCLYELMTLNGLRAATQAPLGRMDLEQPHQLESFEELIGNVPEHFQPLLRKVFAFKEEDRCTSEELLEELKQIYDTHYKEHTITFSFLSAPEGFLDTSPHGFELDGKYYKSLVHYYQSMKFLDPELREQVSSSNEPLPVAMRLVNETRPDWDDVKVEVMYRGLKAKFEQNESIRRALLDTGDASLVFDTTVLYMQGFGERAEFWGCVEGRGNNAQGKLLERVRDELRKGSQANKEEAKVPPKIIDGCNLLDCSTR